MLPDFPSPSTWAPGLLLPSGPALLSPSVLQDSLSLGRSEQPHPICSFQDDFQEFEMIDDNEEEDDEDEEEEEEEEEGDGEGQEGGDPGSEAPAPGPLIPSPSVEEPHKHRPTTLRLTTLGAQDSQDPEAAAGPGGVELVDMETLNPTRDTITPLWAAPGRAARPGRACSAACSEEEDEEDDEEEEDAEDSAGSPGGRGTGPSAPRDASLVYDAVKYTLVVDEHTQLELVSLRRCAGLGHDSEEDSGGEASEEEAGAALLGGGQVSGDTSPDSPDLTFSKKFLNVFVNSTSRSSSTESFGLFSCLVNGEEREQTHRAVFRFIPRHPDELELDVDDPVLVEAEEDDFWFRGFNMRTGERGVFPAFYAHAVPGPAKDLLGSKRSPCWVERFDVQFLGSVEVPCHQGNGILCAAMQKIATARKLTVHLRPPASCDLEISLRGVKLSLSGGGPEFQRCSHFFQMKNISFCGCHPRNSCEAPQGAAFQWERGVDRKRVLQTRGNVQPHLGAGQGAALNRATEGSSTGSEKGEWTPLVIMELTQSVNSCYFGFITKHPLLSRFACHVFVSQESMRPVAQSVGRAFLEYYQEHLAYACPTEDIYLE
ncbi:mitogen-activated protein kinase 8 interacting protein 2, isoform CRA_b [Homo sapiens]|uniref:Isoform 3 of C-Jun-amino-terminal kinase-interacting protein 2 n=1 Tax=Homo sapiens TaxID=9606 RepID=Q13387-3|nr:hypothetical protein 384D8_2 [Homo sapiens]EAW73578.1 mitogen-activated protein kinase 8 interacting protein 2, isoform CRA_b [Homo sapiens]